MSDNNKDSVFNTDDSLYGKKPNIKAAPSTQIGIDTDSSFYDNIIDAASNKLLDTSALDKFTSSASTRSQMYDLIDMMGQDSTISAVLETYAEDATETNENGDIVWADSNDVEVKKMVDSLLKSMRVNKNVYSWVYSLVKYGDVYLRLYRESDYENDGLFDDEPEDSGSNEKMSKVLNESKERSELDDLDKETLNEEVKIRAYSRNDKYVAYLEAVPNPAEMFELTKFGKTYAYIKANVNTTSTTANKNNYYQGSDYLQYSFKKQDINVYQATEFVHGCLDDEVSRTPEEVKIYLTKESDADLEKASSTTYKVKRGKSILQDAFKIWRQLTLLENAILLNRLTKSSVVRAIGVEVGDMPKEMVQPHLQGIKSLMEQKGTLDVGGSFGEYTNPGPVENNIYIPTHNGVGALSVQQIGGDVNVGDLTDLDYFRDKLFSALKVPKQYFGCLRGNTPVLLLNGEKVAVEEMYQRRDDYIGKGILACNEDGSLCPTIITNIMLTKPSASFVRITLDNGEYVDVTPDHVMMRRDGSFVFAEDLKVGESLMPYYDKVQKGRRYVLDNKRGKYLPQYRVVAESVVSIPKSYQVHHKDMRKINDDFDNLEVLTVQEHYWRHFDTLHDAAREANVERSVNNVRSKQAGKVGITNGVENRWIESDQDVPEGFWKGHVHVMTSEGSEKLARSMSERRKGKSSWNKGLTKDTDSRLREKTERWRDTFATRKDAGLYDEKFRKHGEWVKENQDLTKLHESNMSRHPANRIRRPQLIRCACCHKVFEVNMHDDEITPYFNMSKLWFCSKECSRIGGCGKLARSYALYRECGKDLERYKAARYKNDSYFTADRLEMSLPFVEGYEPRVNHKIINIEEIDVKEPAYDISVKADCHTFALPCGIFVHNCTDDASGFNGGSSLSIISARYAKTVVHVQNAMVQALTDAVNLLLLNKGLKGYVNKFKLHMVAPVTQADIDKRENMAGKVQVTSDIMNLIDNNIENPVVKLEILKNQLSSYITDPDVLNILQQEIDNMKKEGKDSDEAGEEGEGNFDMGSDFGGGGDFGGGEEDFGFSPEEPVEEPAEEESTGGEEEETVLPTPADLGLDFTDSSSPEFQ